MTPKRERNDTAVAVSIEDREKLDRFAKLEGCSVKEALHGVLNEVLAGV